MLNHRTAAATPSAPLRSEIMAAGGWLMVTVGPARLRHEVPTEVDLAATSFKAAAPLTPADALLIARELLAAAAAQLKPNVWRSPKTPAGAFLREQGILPGMPELSI